MAASLKSSLALTVLALAMQTPGSQAMTVDLPHTAPLPDPRPYAPASNIATAASVAIDSITNRDLSVLKTGLDSLYQGNTARALQVRNQLAADSLDRRILTWAISMSNAEDIPSIEIASAAKALSDWPGTARRRANSERALYRENPSPEAVLAAFGDTKPTTFEGTITLARAYETLNRQDAARALLSSFWRWEKLDTKEERAFLSEFGHLLSEDDHHHRMERMLYEDRIRSAERVAPLVNGEALTEAWAAVIRGNDNAGKLLEAVPEAQRSAGYFFAKARHLRRSGKFTEAAQIVESTPTDHQKLIDPEEWWVERRVLSRELLDIGEPGMAYRVAAGHSAQNEVARVDAEFHAGWYALRHLNDPETAADHFARIAEVAEGAISLSRAYYWLGRTAEAGGPGNSKAYYERAAALGTAFYGQLAAAHLGRNTIDTVHPEPTPTDRRSFTARETVRAIRRLQQADYDWLADTLYRAVAKELPTAGELSLLAAMAEQSRGHSLALQVGKIAAGRGLDVGVLTHPLGAIPADASIEDAGKALAYAIARQESEFNVAAQSGVGARGLLQLMPGTARDMARSTGLPYSVSRLTSDASYNATLGAAYLSEQLDRFSGSYILTFIAYNAGPRRALDWIERYGDPRGKPIDEVVDWVERIPFTETRNYVQRVMENYQVYKMRLTGGFDTVQDLTAGR